MTGAKTLMQQEKKEDEIQTAREVLLKFLELRFGYIPDTVTNKIPRIRSRARLNWLIGLAATAKNLDDIKWD